VADDDLRRDDTAILHPVSGHVVNREDPKGLGRIRVNVPGLLEPSSAWAWPIGTGAGGSKDTGNFDVPEIGAEVVLMFLWGDLNFPVYLGGWWGKPDGESEVPSEAQRTPPDNHVRSTRSFRVELDETEGARAFRISFPETGDEIEYDAEEFVWRSKGTSAANIVSDGQVTIDGVNVAINGRVVRATEDPI
jgi:hypothetical protein